MIQIDNYFLKDDFKYEIHTFSGIDIYVANGQLWAGKDAKRMMLYNCAETHVCEACGKPTRDRGWLICESCGERKEFSNYLKLKEKESETNQIYSKRYDEYFEELDDFLFTKMDDMSIESLVVLDLNYFMLQPTYNVHPNLVDIESLCEDSDEDFEVSNLNSEIFGLEEQINELLKNEVIAISPMNNRLKITEEMEHTFIDCRGGTVTERENEMGNNT